MTKLASKVVRPLAKGQITIPAEFRRKLGIDTNTFLNVSLGEDNLVITPLRIRGKEALREYSDEDIERFLEEDKIDAATARRVRELLTQGKI